jgi:hypothetical protein
MKILITESQLRKIISEQSDASFDRRYGTADAAAKTNADNRALVNSVANWYKQNAHTVNTVLQIGTAFIPLVGPFISAGIGLADASIYYKNGDTKQAGLVAILSILPGAGKLVSKIPAIAQLGEKGMAALAVKLGTNKALTSIETGIVDGLSKNVGLVQQESSSLVQKLAQKAVQTHANAHPLIQKAAKAGLNAAKTQVRTQAVTATYNAVVPKV